MKRSGESVSEGRKEAEGMRGKGRGPREGRVALKGTVECAWVPYG